MSGGTLIGNGLATATDTTAGSLFNDGSTVMP
jgi:hypothetical protein